MSVLELPFLYHTRTLLRPSPHPRFSTSSRSHAHAAEQDAQHASASFFTQKGHSTTVKKAKARSTITPTERKVFQNIFSKIAETPEDTTRLADTEIDHKKILSIFASSVQKHAVEREHWPDGRGRPDAAGIDVSRYPAGLRKAARRATARRSIASTVGDQTATPSSTRSTPRDPSSHHDDQPGLWYSVPSPTRQDRRDVDESNPTSAGPATSVTAVSAVEEKLRQSDAALQEVLDHIIDHVTRRQMQQIASTFHHAIQSRQAETDLWQASLLLLFPLAQHLTKTPAKGKASKVKASSAAPVPEAERTAAVAELRLPDHIQPLRIISQLYPAALLLLLRLYVKYFPTSPYALAILPQVRSWGLESYVLGANIHFYNALIKLRWEIYADLREISDLLTEIEKSGLEPDVTTYNIIQEIEADRWSDLHADPTEQAAGGGRGRAWWSRPVQVQDFHAVCVQWKRRIAGRLQELGLPVDTVEREYGDTLGQHVRGDDAAAQQAVWI